MANLFLTIKEALARLEWTGDDRQAYWHFVLSLPFADVGKVGYFVEGGEFNRLTEYRDSHPMWKEDEYNAREISNKLPLDVSNKNAYRLARTLYQILQRTDTDLAGQLRDLFALVIR